MFKRRWLAVILAALIALATVLTACGGDDDDDDDTGDDDDSNWEDDPQIATQGDDALDALTEDALAALDLAPAWLYRDLLVAFSNLTAEDQDIYAGVILDAAEDRFVDELAFSIAHVSTTDLTNRSFVPEVLEDNVYWIYQNDEILDYVTVLDEGEPGVDEDYYSTVQYELADGPVTLDREFYYWFVVHPRLEDELPAFIDPDTGSMADPPTGVFWRDYLMNHADDDCPGKVECPLLSDVLSAETLMWAGLNDPTDNGAIGAITNWVNTSMVFDSGSVRPIQPVRIYAIHMGRCGEHADLTSAAGRAAIIATTNSAAYSDDHTWNEFYDGQWHEWEPVNGYIDEFDHYDQWGGGGLGLYAVYNARGDGFTWNRTPDYTETCTVEVAVIDEAGNPVEGARVTSAGKFAGRYMTHFADWTDTDGRVAALLGDQGQHFYMQVTSPLGDYPTGDPERAVTGSEAGETYEWEVTLPGTRDVLSLGADIDEDGAGRYLIEVDYDFPTRYLQAIGIIGRLHFSDGAREGSLALMILDRENFQLYDAGDPFQAHEFAVAGTGTITFDVPAPGQWYVVLSNEESVSSAQLGEVAVSILDGADDSVLASEQMTLLIEPGDRILFGLQGF